MDCENPPVIVQSNQISQLLVVSHLEQEITMYALIVERMVTLLTIAGLEIEEKKCLKFPITPLAFIVENLAIHLTIAGLRTTEDGSGDDGRLETRVLVVALHSIYCILFVFELEC